MPGGHDPKIGRDVHGGKLRLCEPHPVLIDQALHAQNFAALKKVLQRQQAGGFPRVFFRGEQSDQARALPTLFGRRHAGLAKQRLLGIGLRIGVLDRDAERIQRIQRVAQSLDPILRGHQTKFKHQRLRAASHCSR